MRRALIFRFSTHLKSTPFNKSDLPTIRPQAGLRNGLRVVLDMKPGQMDVNSSISHDFKGVEVNVGAKHTFPMMSTNTFLVSPGKVTMVEITGERRSTSADFDGLSLADRQCYFEYERPLQLFSRYTSDNCWVECLINRTRMENGNACTPWNMPSPDGHRCCNPMEQQEFFETFGRLDMSIVMGSELCLPDCAGTLYTTRVTAAPFRECDDANMGLSRLCRIERGTNGGPVPQKWAESVLRDYNNSPPSYISDTVKSALRQRGDGEYDAYQEDMAEVMFFFTRDLIQLEKNWLDCCLHKQHRESIS